MQVLKDEPECAAAAKTAFEILSHDAAPPEMIMYGNDPDNEGGILHTYNYTQHITHKYLDTFHRLN